jgi:post-segregation antitoxin (ccd killing protein)
MARKTISIADDLSEKLKEYKGINASEVCERALASALKRGDRKVHAVRRNISIPSDLADELRELGGKINVSKICQEALRRAVATERKRSQTEESQEDPDIPSGDIDPLEMAKRALEKRRLNKESNKGGDA